MGNSAGTGRPAPHSPTSRLRLRRGKKIAGCPCFLSEQTLSWEALTTHDKFRGYVLRHLLDEGFICSVLENGEREHMLGACEGVMYYKHQLTSTWQHILQVRSMLQCMAAKYLEEGHRGFLRDKVEAWRSAAGAGVVPSEGLNAESAFAELQLARPLRACGFLPTLQRRLAVLRELGAAVAEEHRSSCRPFHMRLRSPPPSGGDQEQGDVRLALTMNAVALQSLSTLASLATVVASLPCDRETARSNVELIRAPFAMLADMLSEFPSQSLFKYWSPASTEAEKRVPVVPETATASSAASQAHLAVTGGLHVGWKASSAGSGLVTWQVALGEPATDLTSVAVQWGAGDPTSSTDQHTLPLALSIEASVDGGKVWCGISGGDESGNVALAHKASARLSQHRYPVSLMALRRMRESQKNSGARTCDEAPAVTHIRLRMKGPASPGPAGPLRIYDVAVNTRDPAARPSDVMTVLRQVQSFLLAQHSQDPSGLQEYLLRALIGICEASCALEFELDLVRVCMDLESAAAVRVARTTMGGAESVDSETSSQREASAAWTRGAGEELQQFISTLISAACRAKRQACRQDRERVVRDAGFDPAMSSKWVFISEGGQLVSSADSGHSHSLVHQCLRRGTWSWTLGLERESSGDETTCVGVAVHPVINSCYEDSHQMWMVRCYSGETYSNGGRRNIMTCKIHPLDSIRLTLNCEAGTLSLEVNGVDQGVVFSNVPRDVHPAVCFYGVTKSVRLVELKRIDGDSDSDMSDNDEDSDSCEISERPLHQANEATGLEEQTAQHLNNSRVPERGRDGTLAGPSLSCGEFAMTGAGNRKADESLRSRRDRRRAARGEDDAVAEAIRASTASSQSTGLLAGLSNFAQWYVPRDREPLGEGQDTSDEQAAIAATKGGTPLWMSSRQGNAEVTSADLPTDSTADYDWSIAGRGGHPVDARRRFSFENAGDNDSWRHAAHRVVSNSEQNLVSSRRPTTSRTTGVSTLSRPIVMEHRRVAVRSRAPARVPSAAVEAYASVSPSVSPSVSSNKRKPLSLEEPYVIQPTATVFHKLYQLLVRSLAQEKAEKSQDKSAGAFDSTRQADGVLGGVKGTARSRALSLLQIMRANFCRLVDAHVDPAEVGLLLGPDGEHHWPGVSTGADKQNNTARVLPNILRCLQGIMLQDSESSLLRAAVDTISSGLPLLLPQVKDRLHLLLALVRHLKRPSKDGGVDTRQNAATEDNTSSVAEDFEGKMNTGVPRERVTLLRNLLRHFARTESVLQLLALFEENEAERDAVSNLFELMLTSMADKACLDSGNLISTGDTREKSEEHETPPHVAHSGERENPDDRSLAECDADVDAVDDGKVVSYASHWEELVASGAGGTTLNFTLLETCQQHLLWMVLSRDRTQENPYELLLCQYGQCLLQVCCRVLNARPPSVEDDMEDDGSPSWHLLGVLLPPFLHGLCLCSDRPRVAEGVLPSLVGLSQALSTRIARNPNEAKVAAMADAILRQTQLTNPEEGLALAPSGWHPVRASFEVDKDCMTSFAISEDGQLYSALTSSNTCALVDVGVSQGKAAWEFLLEEDTHSDECSVFGVATKPLYSRCYNSSHYLRMRRAYNGVLYDRGRQLPSSHNLCKVHPGDVIRCEVDMDEGTVWFSVNGEKQDGGFHGVEGEVFPCAGSYRSGVAIRLLKMEIMGKFGLTRGDENGAGALAWDPTELSWAPAPCSKATRGGVVSIDKKAMELRRMNGFCLKNRQHGLASTIRTARAGERPSVESCDPDASLSTTVSPEQNAVVHDHFDRYPTEGVAARSSAVGTLEIAEAEAWDWVTVQATRGFRASQGKHAVEMEVTPVGTGRRRPVGDTRKGNTDKTSLRRYPMAFGLCTENARSHDCPVGLVEGSWGWWTDGSLRAHGTVFAQARHCGDDLENPGDALYGWEFLPLKPCDIVTVVADTFRGTVRYLVNGVDAGLAFGPPGSGAACALPAREAPFLWNDGAILFPSCSLTNEKQVVQLRPAGTLGTQLWPLSVDLHKTVASLAGRLCATMVAGIPQDEKEVALEPWLRSPLLSGGVQASEKVMGSSDWRSLGRRSWKQAWDGEQEGRPVRRRSFMGWTSRGRDVARYATPAAERVGNEDQNQANSDVSLVVRVIEATRIPRGLVLWPDDPVVRLTADVEGRDHSVHEETMVVSRLSTAIRVDSLSVAGELQAASDGGSTAQHRLCPAEVTCLEDETRCGQQEHTFALRVATRTSAVGSHDRGSWVSPVSLRIEVLVGGLVTCFGKVSLPYTQALTTGANNSRHVVQLSGGAAMTIGVNLAIVKPWPNDAADDASPSVCKIPQKFANQSPRVRSDSVGSSKPAGGIHMQRFLRSIASHRADKHTTSSVAGTGGEDPLVSRSTDDNRTGGDAGTNRQIEPDEGSLFTDLAKWLGRSHPDPPFLRMALEKTGNYSFPYVEAPFVAALLKHSGLVGEAFHAARMMAVEKEGAEAETHVPCPTNDMAKLWGRVRQLRAHLRTQRQQYKVMAADNEPGDTRATESLDPAHGDASHPGDVTEGFGNLSAEEKNETEAETEREQEPDYNQDQHAPDGHDDEGKTLHAATFAELCTHMTERANFLLELAPSTIRCASAAAEGTSALMHHLAEEMSDLPTPPPARLQSRLLRWRSEDHGKERWKCVVDVLRVQSQLRRSASMSFRPRAKSLGSRPLVHAETLPQRENAPGGLNLSSDCIREGHVIHQGTSLTFTKDTDCSFTLHGGLENLPRDSSCVSGDESDDSGESGLLDDATAATAALQACTIYVTTGGAVAPPRTLKAALRNRTSRAVMRKFGLEALAALIRTLAPDGVADASVGAHSTVQEALVFLRPAFRGLCVKVAKDGNEAEIKNDEHDPRHHYLKGLEGCSASLLAGVQSSFEDLYGLLQTLLDHSLQAGQPGLAHVLMTSWALDFESRDHRFLAHKSGILPTLQAMVTLTNTARMASSLSARLDPAIACPEGNSVTEKSTIWWQHWTPWSLDSIREGFVQGTLMARDLARHISRIPPSTLPPGFLKEAELHGSAADILRRHSMASLMQRYSALLRTHLKHSGVELAKQVASAAEKRNNLENLARERVAEMVARGVPVLDEREGKKAPEVQLTALCSWATVPLVESVACTFARGVMYMGTGAVPVAEASSVFSSIAKSGNYYEVTVMNPGDKTTIGVGLADPDVFPATKQMPGWIDHSYGYHGDDGRKFGRGKTDSIWPTWVDGDVIGCGFDPARGAIWYTRNGKLLGDGFLAVHESNLVPVVGFHSNGESVRVNFGVSPFLYEGDEVIVAPAVLAERERLRQEASEGPFRDAALVEGAEHVAAGDRTDGGLGEGKGEQVQPRQSGDPSDSRIHHFESISPEAVAPSIKKLQAGASSLLRFLVAVSMRQATPAAVSAPREGVMRESARNGSPSRVEGSRQVTREHGKRSAPSTRTPVVGDDGTAAGVTVASSIPPTRERSMYGTPLQHMQTHVDSLHQDIFDLIFRELRLGALSLSHISTTTTDTATPDASKRARSRVGFDFPGRSSAGMFVPAEGVKPEMRRSYSHGSCLPGVDGRTSNIRKGVRVSGGSTDEEENATVPDSGLWALEIGDVEPHVYGQLALLCSLRNYAVARVQLSHPSALGSILCLLKVGSPRVQRCVILLLGSVLPGVEPTVVDTCLPENWLRPEREPACTPNISASPVLGKEQDKIEGATQTGRSSQAVHGLVGVLFSTVRRAYGPVSLSGDVTVDAAGAFDTCNSASVVRGGAGTEREGARFDSIPEQRCTENEGLLIPGCGTGYGAGLLDLGLADQCSTLLRELFKEAAWKEPIARMLLVSIRTAASSVRELSNDTTPPTPTDPMISMIPAPSVRGLRNIISDAVGALAIIASSSGVLYPGAAVQSTSGARGTVVLCSIGVAQAGVVFDGQNVEGCERLPARDLEVVGAGFQTDPDTPAQPVIAQLLSLLGAVLSSEQVSQALSATNAEELKSGVPAMAWSRLLSQTLVAVLQLSVHCSDAVVAACQEGDVVAKVLPMLLRVAVCPIQLPALLTAQEFRLRWRATQARMLSALHLEDLGPRTLQPIQKRPLPPPEVPTAKKGRNEARTPSQECYASSPSGSRDTLSAEESRGQSLTHLRRQISDSHPASPDPASARWARIGGRGRLMAMSDAHRGLGRGWGSSMHSRRVVGAWSALDWGGRGGMEEEEDARDGGRRRLLRSDSSQRVPVRGRRATSVESRLDSRRSMTTRLLHARMRGFAEPRDEETGALLVEFNDGTDETATDIHGLEGGSAGSAETADTSQDGDEEEMTMTTTGEHEGVEALQGGAGSHRGSDLLSPDLPLCVTSGQGASPAIERQERLKLKPSSSGFPVSHVLTFGPEVLATRDVLSAQLSEEFGVSLATARAALEMLGDDEKTRQWFLKQDPPDAVGRGSGDNIPPATSANQAMDDVTVDDEAVVCSLAASGGLTGCGGDSAGVPSAEEGLNLWEPDEQEARAMVLDVPAFTQRVDLLCEHDLVPVLGTPRPAPVLGGAAGTVSSSFLAREADLLAPGSLLIVTSGEGYAPEEMGPYVTVAREMPRSTGHERGQGHGTGSRGGLVRIAGSDSQGASGSRTAGTSNLSGPGGAEDGLVVDGEEVLVEMMDAETGLCLGRRVPIGDLRHSTSFFGRKLDMEQTTCKKLLHDTDMALSILRARSLLVRLIHSLNTPAIAAAGGPRSLLNLTRLLAAQDLANGSVPTSVWSSADSLQGSQQLEIGYATGEVQGTDHSVLQHNDKVVGAAHLDQDSLLKVLWSKVMQSPGPWASDSGVETASATLGEMLAQEVLDSFNALATAPQTLLSGDVGLGNGYGSGAVPVMTDTLSSTLETNVPGKGSIAHESLHPICTPLSYGGHIEVDSNCCGMVVKVDSRSRTSSDVVRLQFFSSPDDMLNDRNPIRVMHGHVPDRAARARAKGMEFFKIEEADSTSFDVTSSSLEDALSISALDRINLPPPLVRHGSSSTNASASGGSSRHPSGTAHRVTSSSEAAVRGLYETQSRGVMSRWARVKDAPALTQSTAFRSFALPGVHKLWFRFDAPPGAEKPPLKMETLVGSLDNLPSGKLRANLSSSTGRDNSVHSEQDEDLSQEDMGLKALFTFFGADHAEGGAAPPGVGPGSMLRTESDEKSSLRSQVSPNLPGCLVALDGICLTRGKWFYEVTIDSLMDQAAGDDNLVRIGWAHLELSSAVQGMYGLKPKGGSSSWGARASGSRQRNDDDARKPQPHESTRTLQGHTLDSFKPAEPALGWLYHTNPTEDAELARAEAEAKGVGFPVVGSDSGHLALGLGRRGFVWVGGRPVVRATRRLEPKDVIGCAIDVGCGDVRFSVNGIWATAVPNDEKSQVTVGTCMLSSETFKVVKGVRPCLSVRGSACLSVNFGATPFRHAPPGDAFLPVILRDVHTQPSQSPAEDLPVTEMSKGGGATESEHQRSRKPSKSNMAPEADADMNWGFRFVVDPLRGVPYRVIRDLELICRFGGSNRAGAASSGVGAQILSIWRPKAPPGWYSVGDVASRGLLPPAGAIVVRADTTGCLMSKPAKFRVVHQDKNSGYMVWRPVPRKGQVSLGDFACAKKASKAIMAGAVRCVAAWAVERCPVVQCLWREEKKTGNQAIWSVQNGLGTFFGSLSGGRLSKREVTQGPQSRAERQKRKKKKSKKKKSGGGGDSSDDEEGERVKLRLGVGEGWALRGVSASCITNEWREESDVISGPVAPKRYPISPTALQSVEAPGPSVSGRQAGKPQDKALLDRGDVDGVLVESNPTPSVSWASWLLSFLLNHPSLRRLAMRPSLFRALTSYLRSPRAPHRLRVVPLLTLLIRSHAEFEHGPPPLEEVDGLIVAVLQECDRATRGRGPGSMVWRTSDCPGGLQLETRWANEGLLLLTDLAIATRRAQDSLRQPLQEWSLNSRGSREEKFSQTGDEQQVGTVLPEAGAIGMRAVKVSLPPFGTRIDESPVEEGEDEEADEVERSLAARLLLGGRLLGAEDRALLEVDQRNAVLPDVAASTPLSSTELDNDGREEQENKASIHSPSRCLHHLIEILDTLRVLRSGWPSPGVMSAPGIPGNGEDRSLVSPEPVPSLDSILCEAWMDAVGPAAVIESEHPFREGMQEETLCFHGAEEVVVFLDPQSSMQVGKANLVLEGKDKMVTITGRQEMPWSDIITFRGESVTYRFQAESDGERTGGSSLMGDSGADDWGFRFTVVAKGPVWEAVTLEGDFCSIRETDEFVARVPGALSLLVELNQSHDLPRECDIEVKGFTAEGDMVDRGTLAIKTPVRPVYVRGDRVKLVPLRKHSQQVDTAADKKEGGGSRGTDFTLSSKQEDSGAATSDALHINVPDEPGSTSDTDAMPDADAKLERLPSNTPVLRPWGEATGVERRWRSPADETFDMERMTLAGASYMSNAATVEVGDSDAESKDGSTNSAVSSGGERRTWTRNSTLSDVIASGLPLLSAMSSDCSEVNRGSTTGLSALHGTSISRVEDSVHRVAPVEGLVWRGGDGGEFGEVTETRMSRGSEGGGDLTVDDARSERASTSSSRPRACAGAKDATDDLLRVEHGGAEEESKAPSSSKSSSKWMVRVRAAAMPRKARLRLYLERQKSLVSPGPSLEKAREWMMAWTPEMDVSLLHLLGTNGTKATEESCAERGTNVLNPWCCRLTRAEARFQLQLLAAVPAQSLHIRAALLLRLNDRIERVLPVIDLGSKQEDSLGWQLREMNHLVLPHIKNAVLEAALAVTQGPGDGVAVSLDNVKSMVSRDRGETDLVSSQCVFAQAYRQLRDTEAKVLRTVWDGERVFQINFVGEDGVDAGGVFREGMSRMVEDLFSSDFDLLIPCPNGQQAIGQNNEKYVPNPQHSSPLALSMLRFVGRLMGLSLRTRLCLPFQLPGMIWKRMLGLQIGFEDLRLVDTIICQFLTAIRSCEEDGLTSDEEFREKYGERLFFTYTGSDGMERELAPGGAARRVTFDNRWVFCRMVEEARTHEFDVQAAAMAEGLSDIVPMKVLRLLTAKQLEVAVAGEPEFDIAFWREHTEYKGYRPEDATVDLFWKVIASMSPEDQSGFVRFAWGRSRLPPKTYWRVNMKILRRNTGEDSLPVSHTCFFSLELPPYSTEDRMRKGLLTAIHFGMGGILNA